MLSCRNLIFSQTCHHARPDPDSEERSAAASQRHPGNSTSWNRIKDGSDTSGIAVTGTERCGNEMTTGAASRPLIYDCPSWSYAQVVHYSAHKDSSSSTALTSSSQVSADPSMSAAVAEIAINAAAAVLHPWSATLRAAAGAPETDVHGVTATGPGSVSESCGADVTAGGNPRGAIVGPRMEAVMSAVNHSCRAAHLDADLTMLYMEGQPRKPVLKQRWPAETSAAMGPPGRAHQFTGGDRESLSF